MGNTTTNTINTTINNEKENEVMCMTPEEMDRLVNDAMEMLEHYQYNPTYEAVRKIVETWYENNKHIINAMQKTPYYVKGEYMMKVEAAFERKIDSYECIVFFKKLRNKWLESKVKTPVFTCGEINRMKDHAIHNMWLVFETHKLVKGFGVDYWREEMNRCDNLLRRFSPDGTYYGANAEQIVNDSLYFMDIPVDQNTISKETAEKLNSMEPQLKAREGQKLSKVINKFAKVSGLIENWDTYNRDYAAFSDAVNPMLFPTTMIFSVNLFDYWRMSFGNSWTSCHTIDKFDVDRRSGSAYHGMYSYGTESYMLDSSSVVVYTVDSDVKEKYYMAPKNLRCMFHIGNGKMIQGRVYPQANDNGAMNIYSQLRDFAQRMISAMWEVPNFWKNKGFEAIRDNVTSLTYHYEDYHSFNTCTLCELKEMKEEDRPVKIKIGHKPICPSCGVEHNGKDTEAIECPDCFNGDGYECYYCGVRIYDEEDAIYSDGHYYCRECVWYCEGCDDFHPNNVDSYYFGGNYCEDYLCNSDWARQCAHCGEWFDSESSGILTEDWMDYCDSYCAERAGYAETDDGEWYPESETCSCESCGSIQRIGTWNLDIICDDCAEDEEDEEDDSDAI